MPCCYSQAVFAYYYTADTLRLSILFFSEEDFAESRQTRGPYGARMVSPTGWERAQVAAERYVDARERLRSRLAIDARYAVGITAITSLRRARLQLPATRRSAQSE